jgi:hypothetical protein
VEIFKLFGSIFVDNSAANDAIDQTDEKAEKTSGTFGKMGGAAKVLGGAIVAGVGIAAGAMTGLMAKTMETASEINKFSQVNGMTTKEFQQWDSVAKNFGFSMEAASGDMAALAERAMDAASGVGENADMFKKLGVTVTDSNGKLKTQGQLFDETIKGLQGMEDVTERNAIATAMLSTTGEELAPVLNMTNEELNAMKQNANVISDDNLSKAAEFGNKWNQAKNVMTGIVTEIGFKVMPIFQTMLDWVMANMPTIQAVIDKVFTIIGIAVNVVVTIFKDYLLPILTTLFEWIAGYMPTIRATVETVFNKIVEVARGVWTFFKDNILPILQRLVEFIQSKMPQIRSIIETVFGIIVSVVRVVWDIFENFLLPVLKKLWDWVSPYIPKIQTIIEKAFGFIFDAVNVVVNVFDDVVTAVQKAIDWLSFWDNKKVSKKTIEVEERRTTSGNIPGNATGTGYFQGGLSLVGERGPELVELPRGSKINPANVTRNKLSKQETKQPTIIQIVTPDKRKLAEWLVDDITDFQEFSLARKSAFEG